MKATLHNSHSESRIHSGAALREAIRRAGLSYEALAHRLGLKGRSSVAQWCSGAISVPLIYHVPLRQILRSPHLFPETAIPISPEGEHSLLGIVLRSYASMPELPLDLVERSSWEVWNECAKRADWHSAGRYVASLQEAIVSWRGRLGVTTRRLERIRWAGAHGQLRSELYTCDWEQVEMLSVALRQEIYRSPWLGVLDHSEQALILNTLSLADFFLKSRFRKLTPAASSGGKVSSLRQALTAALNHIGEAQRRLRLPQNSDAPPASALRIDLARLLLDATEASMIYEAREDPDVAHTLVNLADRAAAMAVESHRAINGARLLDPLRGSSGTSDSFTDSSRTDPPHRPVSGLTPLGIGREYQDYLFDDIFPRIELECRYNAAVIAALDQGGAASGDDTIRRSALRLEELADRLPESRHWRGEVRITELLTILERVLAFEEAIPRDTSLEMRHVLSDLREDFNRNALMGLARSAASLEILLDVNLARLPAATQPEREERLQSAAELVDWMYATVETFPDTPTRLVVQWDRAVLALLSGVREASTVRDLIEALSRFREYGGPRIIRDASRFMARIAAGEFGARAAAAVPASLRDNLPSDGLCRAGGADMILTLSPLLYPMMPISFIRPQGYEEPSQRFWSEPFPVEPIE